MICGFECPLLILNEGQSGYHADVKIVCIAKELVKFFKQLHSRSQFVICLTKLREGDEEQLNLLLLTVPREVDVGL